VSDNPAREPFPESRNDYIKRLLKLPEGMPPRERTVPGVLKIYAVGDKSRLYIITPGEGPDALYDRYIPRVIEREIPMALVEEFRKIMPIPDSKNGFPVYHWLRVAIYAVEATINGERVEDFLEFVRYDHPLAAATQDEVRLLSRAMRGEIQTMPDPLFSKPEKR